MGRISTLIVVGTLLLGCGCVRRRLTVRTNVPGADVYVDKQHIGKTPISTNFTYYGNREIEVNADGFETERVLRKFTPPWYEIPPLDFISETLWPREVRDERVVDIQMVPAKNESLDEIRAKANDLRIQSSQAIVAAPPPTQPSGTFTGPVGPPQVPIQSGPSRMQPSAPQSPPRGFGQPGLLTPNGLPPTRIPEAGILPGGGYRPAIEEPQAATGSR